MSPFNQTESELGWLGTVGQFIVHEFRGALETHKNLFFIGYCFNFVIFFISIFLIKKYGSKDFYKLFNDLSFLRLH